MDELKKYLQNHAAELDRDEPRTQVWQNICKELQVPQKANRVLLVTRWLAAACVLVLAGIAIWFLAYDKESGNPRVTAASKIETPVDAATTAPQNTVPATTQPDKALQTVQMRNPSQSKTLPSQESVAQSVAALKMLSAIENNFTQVINLQRARVSTMPMHAESPEYFDDFKTQIKAMEVDEKSIKSEISKRGLNDVLLDQLINLYQLKLNVLKGLQIEMNKTNNRYKQNQGPVESSKIYFLTI